MKQKEIIKTRLITYHFDISEPKDKIGYEELVKHCEKLGLKKFSAITHFGENFNSFNRKIESLNGKMIDLETKFIFSNQWNSTELRVFDWKEEIYPNRDIKHGYYLVPTDEMKEIRKNNTCCHYCGKMSRMSEVKIDSDNFKICPHCDRSGYLLDLSHNSGGLKFLKGQKNVRPC